MELNGSGRLEASSEQSPERLQQVNETGAIVIGTRSTAAGRAAQVNRIHVGTEDGDGRRRGGTRNFGDDGWLAPAMREEGDGDVGAARAGDVLA